MARIHDPPHTHKNRDLQTRRMYFKKKNACRKNSLPVQKYFWRTASDEIFVGWYTTSAKMRRTSSLRANPQIKWRFSHFRGKI